MTKYLLYFIIYICYNLQAHMYKYLPSKKFVITLLSVIVASGLIYSSVLYRERQTAKIAAVINKNNVSLGLSLNTTSTTAKIVAKEISTSSADYKKAQADFNKLTTTEKMSQDILVQYASVHKSGSVLSPDEIQNIVNNALVFLPKMTFKIYAQKDLQTTTSLDYGTLRNYSNVVAKIMLDNLNNKTESVDSIISDIDTGSSDTKTDAEIKLIFQRFNPLIVKDQQTIASLLTMTVPEVFVNEHLNLLNSFEEIYEKLVLMQKSYNDMAVLVNVDGSYSASVQKLASAMTELTKKLSVAGVTFSSKNDYGYQFFNVIMSGK